MVTKKRKSPSQVLKEVRQKKYRQRVEQDRKKEQKKNPPWDE